MRASSHVGLRSHLVRDSFSTKPSPFLRSSAAVMPGAAQGVFSAAGFSHQAPAAPQLFSLHFTLLSEDIQVVIRQLSGIHTAIDRETKVNDTPLQPIIH